jgi:flagellar brake protein
MFENTRPAELSADGSEDPWASFRVGHPGERIALLRQLRDGHQPIILNGPDGSSLTTVLWAIDAAQGRLVFTADSTTPALDRLVEADEAVAVAYMDSVKLQWDVQQIVLVRGKDTLTLQSALPSQLYRFQRRNAFRVRASASQPPTAKLRHPAIPEMQLALRVLDLSLGGCALWYPADLPPLQAGTALGEMGLELDSTTRIGVPVRLQHVTVQGNSDKGARLGCEFIQLSSGNERVLQRWIDQAQKRRRLMALE